MFYGIIGKINIHVIQKITTFASSIELPQ